MSLIRKKVSPFNATAYFNNEFVPVSDSDLLGHWSVVVFYPNDFTFVCPTELEELAGLKEKFDKEGCTIYSVSTDSHFVHKAWHETSEAVGKVNYAMIGDPSGALARDFDVLVEKDWQALRGSFVINPEGEIVAYEVHDGGIGREFTELLRKVQAARFIAEHDGLVCPAHWKPGEETIKPSFDLVGKI